MPVCIVCGALAGGPICGECRSRLVPTSPVMLMGLTVASGYRHEASARRLVHLLKYQGIQSAARVLAPAMAARLPADATALVAVPRAWVRRIRFGIDPALVLAQTVGRMTGVPVCAALRPRLWWPAHAGRNRRDRHAPGFSVVRVAPRGAVLIDDVVTTGATLLAAAQLLGVSQAVTATRAEG